MNVYDQSSITLYMLTLIVANIVQIVFYIRKKHYISGL